VTTTVEIGEKIKASVMKYMQANSI